MAKFTWGKEIEHFTVDFGNLKLEVTKYFPTKFDGNFAIKGQYQETPMYHSEFLNESAETVEYLIISYIARKNLGLNQHALVHGIAKALEIC